MPDTITHRPSPNYTTQQISDALERAMMKAKYPMLYCMERLKQIEENLKIVEDEYIHHQKMQPPRL